MTWLYEIRNKGKLMASQGGFATKAAAVSARKAMATAFKEVGTILGSAFCGGSLAVTTGQGRVNQPL